MAHRHAEVDEEDLSEFLNDGSWKRGYNIDRSGTTKYSAALSCCMHSLESGWLIEYTVVCKMERNFPFST